MGTYHGADESGDWNFRDWISGIIDRLFGRGMLTGHAIKKEIERHRLFITPYNPHQVKANSYDVQLAPILYRITDFELDFRKPYNYEEITIPQDGYVLYPGETYLGCTLERTYSPCHVAEYNGRSTTGRYFLLSHITAGFGDVGFDGHWTLEIMVAKPTRVYPGMKIGQICFQTVRGRKVDYKAIYNSGNYNTAECLPKVGKPNNI